jgi:hypothetical protein
MIVPTLLLALLCSLGIAAGQKQAEVVALGDLVRPKKWFSAAASFFR